MGNKPSLTLDQLNELAGKHNEQIKDICIEALIAGNTPELESRYAEAKKLDKYFTSLATLLWDEERRANASAEMARINKVPYDA